MKKEQQLELKLKKFNELYYINHRTTHVIEEVIHPTLLLSEMKDLQETIKTGEVHESLIYDHLKMQNDPIDTYYDAAETTISVYDRNNDIVLELTSVNDLVNFVENLEI